MTQPQLVRNLLLGEGSPKICIPLVGKNLSQLKEEASQAKEAGADLVEWRADFFEDLYQIQEIEIVLKRLRETLGEVPILFTIRTQREGGSLQISIEDYVAVNTMVSKLGLADLMDVEALVQKEEMRELILKLSEQTTVIGSSHDFEKTGTQEELLQKFSQLKDSGAHILKLAVMPGNFLDVWNLMQATQKAQKEFSNPLISMSMGEIGAISRILGEKTGSCITFGTAKTSSAPGQIPGAQLQQMLQWVHKGLRI